MPQRNTEGRAHQHNTNNSGPMRATTNFNASIAGILHSWHIVSNRVTFLQHSTVSAAQYISVTVQLNYFKRRNQGKKTQKVIALDSILKNTLPDYPVNISFQTLLLKS